MGVTGAAEGAGDPELEASWQAKSRRVAARANEGARGRGGSMEAETTPKHLSAIADGRRAAQSGESAAAGVLGQGWRGAARRAPLRALMKGPTTVVVPLDEVLAEAAGVLCGRAGTSDVIDASVVLLARRERALLLTNDVDDMRRLDPGVDIERI
jgi:hypothetical protein